MGKKWKRTLVQRRNNGRMEMPSARPEPAVSNAAMVEEMKAAAPAPAPEPEPEMVMEEPVEEVAAPEPEAVEEEPVVEAPKPTRRRSRRKKSTSGD
jgi:hypothetical protein